MYILGFAMLRRQVRRDNTGNGDRGEHGGKKDNSGPSGTFSTDNFLFRGDFLSACINHRRRSDVLPGLVAWPDDRAFVDVQRKGVFRAMAKAKR